MFSALLIVCLVLTIGAGLAAAGVYRTEAQPGVVALLYHRVRDDDEFDRLIGAERNFSVPLSHFTDQLTWLRESGYQFLSIDDVVQITSGEMDLPEKSVAITFDDGSRSVLTHAYGELQRLGMPAAVFVTTDPNAWVFEDQPRLTDDEIRVLQSSNIHIGAHGVTHHGLDQMDDSALKSELETSRETLERLGSEPVVDMALPLNFYNETVLEAAAKAGYRSVFTANPGRIRPGDRLHELRRIAVEGSMTRAEFIANLSARSLTARRIVAYLKRVPPRLLGEERWMPIRRWLFESALGPWLTFRHLKLALIVGVAVWVVALTLLALAGAK